MPIQCQDIKGRDVRSYAVSVAMERCFQADALSIQDCRAEMPEYANADEFDVPVNKRLNPGWGRRPAYGQAYGKNYVDEYRDEVATIFIRGEENDAEKQQAASVVEYLTLKYPHKFDIPSESDIQKEFAKLGRKRRTSAPTERVRAPEFDEAESMRTPTPRPGRMGRRYSGMIDSLLLEDPSIMPLEGLRRVREAFADETELADFPSDDAIRNKISYLKCQARKRTRHES